MILHSIDNLKIAIIGLGYVGLPLAVEFGKSRPVVGFDINASRIAQLRKGQDVTLEVPPEEFHQAPHLAFTDDLKSLADCNTYIVTVPTPIDKHRRPYQSLGSHRWCSKARRCGDL